MKIKGSLVSIENLKKREIDTAFLLMTSHYNNVTREVFEKDLYEKDLIILLRGKETNEIVGFSTQQVFKHTTGNGYIYVLFSGDTIIRPNKWGSLELAIVWGRLMLSIKDKFPTTPLYWMLISKGFRTYRFLPVYFKEFFPNCLKNTPKYIKELIDTLGERKFPQTYNRDTGIVHAKCNSQNLKEEVNLLNKERLKDPYIAYFYKRNPKCYLGDELVCLAEFHRSNLKPFILRNLEDNKRHDSYEEIINIL